MVLNKSVLMPVALAMVLGACSGSDGYGLGNGASGSGGSGGSGGGTGGDGRGDTGTEVALALGTGSGGSFSSGSMSTTIPTGTELSLGGSTTISVNVVDTNASNALYDTPTTVTFSSDCANSGQATIGSTDVTSGGTASVTYTTTSCQGSDTVTATIDSGATASVTFSLSSLDLGTGADASFISGEMSTTLGGADLSFGGDTAVSVNIVDSSDNSIYNAGPVTVTFTSNCVQSGRSTIDTSVITSNGTATAAYSAITCEGPDTITASLSNGTTATTNINVAEQVFGSLSFVGASPDTIGLKGSGSTAKPEVSELTFILRDNTGQPIQGETVSYALSTDVGGITLSNPTSVTATDGTTSIFLNAGTVPVGVSVTASVTDSGGSTFQTSSNPIAIVGGLPDDNSFSLSVSTLNPRGWDFDGSSSTLTIRASDRFNNPAPDGTQVSFTTYGGSIIGNCAISEGVCSVNWTSQNPRPVNYGDGPSDTICNPDADPRNRRSDANPGFGDACGLVKILARTTGEESFQDANSNGFYDDGEIVVTQLAEAYNDENDNGAYDVGEFFSDYNQNGVRDAANSTYQGTGCTAAALANSHCQNLIEVRQTATLCMSADQTYAFYDDARNTVLSGGTITLSGGIQKLYVQLTDEHGLTPAQGTTVTVEGEEVKIIAENLSIPNECEVGGHYGEVTLEPDGDTADGSGLTFGQLKITVTDADGTSFIDTFVVAD